MSETPNRLAVVERVAEEWYESKVLYVLGWPVAWKDAAEADKETFRKAVRETIADLQAAGLEVLP